MKSFFGNASPSRGTGLKSSDHSQKSLHAEQESKRRAFAFMNYSKGQPLSDSSMRRTREHARQIALQLSTNGTPLKQQGDGADAHSPSPRFQAFPTTKPNSNRNRPSNSNSDYVNHTSPLPREIVNTNANNRNQSHRQHNGNITKKPLKPPIENKLNVFMEHQHGNFPSPSSFRDDCNSVASEATPSSFRDDRSGVASVASSVSGAARRRIQRAKRQQPQQRSVDNDVNRNPSSDRTVHSMPTIPSNSSMQAKHHHHHSIQSESPKQSSSQSVTSTSSATARRKMRNQMRGTPEQQQPELTVNTMYTSIDDDTPTTPAHTATSLDSSAWSDTRNIPITTPSNGTTKFSITPNSFQTNNTSDDVDSSVHGGFTFDAFGLDEEELDSEVNAAMQDLAGLHPEVRAFLIEDESANVVPANNNNSTDRGSPNSAFEPDAFNVSHSNGIVRPSPLSSERSSATSSTGTDKQHQHEGVRVNMFKEKAGFHSSKTGHSNDNDPWEAFGKPTGSPKYAKSEPGGSYSGNRWAGLTLNPPKLPNLVDETVEDLQESEKDSDATDFDQASWEGDSDGELSPQAVVIRARSDTGAPSNTGASSGICVSPTIVVNTNDNDTGEVPGEIMGENNNKKSATYSKEDDTHARFGSEKPSTRTKIKSIASSLTSIHDNDSDDSYGFGEPLTKNSSLSSEWEHRGSEQMINNEATYNRSQSSSSKSEVGGYKNNLSLQQERESSSSRIKQQKCDPERFLETHSDIGASVEFYPGVKLKKTSTVSTFDSEQTPVEEESELSEYNDHSQNAIQCDSDRALQPKQLTYRERRELELKQQQAEEEKDTKRDEPPASQMTYRERRELQLKQQRSQQETREVEENVVVEKKRDVASLIRQRIAANRIKPTFAKSSKLDETDEDLATVRNKLKKVSLANDIASPETQLTLENEEVGMSTAQLQNQIPKPGKPTRNHIASSPRTEAEKIAMVTNNAVTFNAPSSDKGRTIGGSSVGRPVESMITAKIALPASEGGKDAAKSMLSAFLGKRIEPAPLPKTNADSSNSAQLQDVLARSVPGGPTQPSEVAKPQIPLQDVLAKSLAGPHGSPPDSSPAPPLSGQVALKEDPQYTKYFRMLKVGMPMDVVKHAMSRDGIDASIMDGDHNKPVGGVPIKEDPRFEKYFKMLKMGLPMGAVKNAVARDGFDPALMDGDHNSAVPGALKAKAATKQPKDTHRRTRLHWDTLRKVRANSLWAKINDDKEVQDLRIDEDEFAELFQAELTPSKFSKNAGSVAASPNRKTRGPSVQVIDPKRANNGGIVLARLKISQDDMADAVDKIDETVMTAEQMQNIVEFLPTSEEKKKLEAHMLEGGMDAATKFDMLCECEKFMVAMMTVKHAKRKVRALLFKLQFESCLNSLRTDANTVEEACDQLSNSVRLRKLLGIVLNIGNRLNTAGNGNKSKAGAFALESLLKLSHAKAFDKKTTFLQYVVLIVQRNNERLLNFKEDLPTVLKSDKIFWDQCLIDLEEVENQLENVRRMALHQAHVANRHRLIKKKKKKPKECDDDDSLSECEMTLEEEVDSLRATKLGQFTLVAIKKVSTLREKVEITNRKFARLQEYFGVDEKRGEMQPHELFTIIVQFIKDFEKAKGHAVAVAKKKQRDERKREVGSNGSGVKPIRSNRHNEEFLKASNLQPNFMQPPLSPSTKSEPGFSSLSRGRLPRFKPQTVPTKESKQGASHYPRNENATEQTKNAVKTTSPRNREIGSSWKVSHDYAETSVTQSTQVTPVPHSPPRGESNSVQAGRPPIDKALSPRSSIRARRRRARNSKG